MKKSRLDPKWERGMWVAMAILLVLILAFQVRSLYEFPQADGARWWGDETGQMLELRAELIEGYARIPTGLGSSVAITNGLVRGNSWLAALIYGVPVSLFSGHGTVVDIGRTITFCLSILLLFLLYRFLTFLNVSKFFALFAVLLLVTTRSFFFASHAARLDVAASIVVLLAAWIFSKYLEDYRIGKWNPNSRWLFFLGLTIIGLATLSIHLLTLLPIMTIYFFGGTKIFWKPTKLLSFAAGIILMLGILFGLYFLSGAPVSLFGPSTGSNQFHSVASNLPILRPLSRSVQVANILERIHGVWTEAPAMLILILISAASIFVNQKSFGNRHYETIIGLTIAVIISWLFFQSPALYYYIHILPLVVATCTIILSSKIHASRTSFITIGIISLVLFGVAMSDTMRAWETASKIAVGNLRALQNIMIAIHSDDTSGIPPIVLAQNPAIAELERNRSIRLMTAHVVSFPTSHESLWATLQRLNVRYMVLYASHDGSIYSDDYHVLRPIADSLGSILLKQEGILFDVHRDYFASEMLHDEASDTMILYKLPQFAR